MLKNLIYILFLLFSIIYSFDTVKKIDIDRFMGKWYVISAIPNFIEKGCKSVNLNTKNGNFRPIWKLWVRNWFSDQKVAKIPQKKIFGQTYINSQNNKLVLNPLAVGDLNKCSIKNLYKHIKLYM